MGRAGAARRRAAGGSGRVRAECGGAHLRDRVACREHELDVLLGGILQRGIVAQLLDRQAVGRAFRQRILDHLQHKKYF